MTTYAADSISEAQVSLVVNRCTCDPEKMDHPGEPCPNGRLEDLGVVAYYNKKRLKRWSWAIRHKLGLARNPTLGQKN